jgi:hypothetical protein
MLGSAPSPYGERSRCKGEPGAEQRNPRTALLRMSFSRKLSYAAKWIAPYAWQRLTRPAFSGSTHLIIALADHFEPAIDVADGSARVPYSEQERRLEEWCREYPDAFGQWRDAEGRPFVHTYFYPAEQYDGALIERLADHCHSGWGEIEVHLHHGVGVPDNEENTRRLLTEFRDALALRHGCLSYESGSSAPRYVFVHGNFALANSNGGRGCGVDSEMQVLAETGCYADMTLPAAPFHRAQTAKINSLYECALPLNRRAPQRQGRELSQGRVPNVLPIIVQGPLMVDFASRSHKVGIENGSITPQNPLSVRRLRLWKQAAIRVTGRPDWLFIKLHCHSMDPRQKDAVLGAAMKTFLRDLVEGAGERREILHFVSAREMVNIIFAACAGRSGNPGDYRDYRFQMRSTGGRAGQSTQACQVTG